MFRLNEKPVWSEAIVMILLLLMAGSAVWAEEARPPRVKPTPAKEASPTRQVVRPVMQAIEVNGIEIGQAVDLVKNPPMIIYDDATRKRMAAGGSVAAAPFVEAPAYYNWNDSGFAFFTNFNASTGTLFPGAFVADEMILGNGFGAGDQITSYELLVLRSNIDPQPGTADIKVQLMGGDPACTLDVTACGTPIPGTEGIFTGLPIGVFQLRLTLGAGVTMPTDRVWMVVSGDSPASPCRLGWRISTQVPVVGDIRRGAADVFEAQQDVDAETNGGTCCIDGVACTNAAPLCAFCGLNGAKCNYNADCPLGDTCFGGFEDGNRLFCSDGFAENNVLANFGGPCTGGAGDFCASFTARVFGPAGPRVELVPVFADRPNVINGNKITVRPDTAVWFHLMFSNWNTGVQTWQATIDSSGYQGQIFPWNPFCQNDADCAVMLGNGSKCNDPAFPPGGCSPGFQDFSSDNTLRLDFPAVRIVTNDFSYGSAAFFSAPAADDGLRHYGGTLVLLIPNGTPSGRFEVGFKISPTNDTFMLVDSSHIIPKMGTVPAIIEVTDCLPAAAPLAEVLSLPGNPVNLKNRVLSIVSGNSGLQTAIRVTFDNLPGPFGALNGQSMWVGQPQEFCENSGQTTPPPGGCGPSPGASPTFFAATLQCDPFYTDWSAIGDGTIHIQHEFIVPGAGYTVQAIGRFCNTGMASNFSSPLVVNTGPWGDVIEDCSTTPCGPPNGSVGVTTDVTSILNKFQNLAIAPSKVRVDLEPSGLDLKINISDVTQALDAFGSMPYPFTPSRTCACPPCP